MVVSKNMFDYQYAIGKGGFGKVWRVIKKKDKQVFAMKECLKLESFLNVVSKVLWMNGLF